MKKIILTLLFLSYISIQVFGGEYLKIKFKSKASIATSRTEGPSILISFQDIRLNVLFAAYTITDYRREYPIADSFPNNLAQAVRLRLWYRVRISGNPKDKIKELKAKIDAIKSPDIDTVIQANDPIALSTPPNDYYNCFACNNGGGPQASNHLDLINALGAWEITKGLSCIKIGITDEFFQHHEDLDNKVIITPRTAYIGPADTTKSHSTEVAGTAGAETNNNRGISSLGYNISLSYYNNDYNGILNAIYDRCKVVNCSWFSDHSETSLPTPDDIKDVLALAQLNNVTIVAAAGNRNFGSATEYFYPASYNGVISVTAVGSQFDLHDPASGPDSANWKDCHRKYNNPDSSSYNFTYQHNDSVDICAPGYYIETTARNNNYGNTGGTSFSAPLVSAAAALLYSINPFFTPAQIEAYLKDSAANIYNVCRNSDWLGKLGAGRLNARGSLKLALSNAYTGNYCNSCPTETTRLTVTHTLQPPNILAPINGYFYNKYIFAGSNNSDVVTTSGTTTLVATNSIILTAEFSTVATLSNLFSARIEPCNMPGGRIATNSSKNNGLPEVLNENEQSKVYPNPTNNIITITYSSQDKGQVDIKIMNAVGVEVKRIHKNSDKSTLGKTEINVKDLSNGLYYIIVKSGNKTYTNKFVKINK